MLHRAQVQIQARKPVPSIVRSTAHVSLESSLETMGAMMHFARNNEIYGDDEPADYLYKVVSGAARTYKVLADGRRQVAAFYLPGDMFGFEAGKVHALSAEAISDSRILIVKRSAVMDLAVRDPNIAKQLWTMTGREVQRAHDHVLILIKSAEERVAGFLVDMARRSSDANAVRIPMSRQDIADYLGLTIETVSRMLTLFQKSAAIALPSARCVEIRNRAALNRLNA